MPVRRSRLFSWLNTWRQDELQGTLQAIYVCAAAGEAMQAVDAVNCLAGRGLEGDRYAEGRGHWIKTDGCEVTLITLDDLNVAHQRSGLAFDQGQHRRNLVVHGIPLAAFQRHRVRIGEALFDFHRLRPPCAYLDRVAQSGAAKALSKRAGIGLHVIGSGRIRVGDPVRVIVPEDR